MSEKKPPVTVQAFYHALDTVIPRRLSCSWDNDGLSCCPDPAAPVTGILVALDATEDAVDLAVETGCNVILTHHPLLFRGLKAVSGADTGSRKVIRMIRAGISAMSFHTRLDALDGGVNDCLAATLGLVGSTAYGEADNAAGIPMGRMGTLETPMSMEAFAVYVADRLAVPATLGLPVDAAGTHMVYPIPGIGEYTEVTVKTMVEHLTPARPAIHFADCGKSVSTVAVLGGAGESEIAAAVAAGADTFITGELGYHTLCDAPYGGINLMEAGHYFTEFPVCRYLMALAAEFCPDVPVHILGDTRIGVR